jgi:hypothetical protein
MTIRALVLVVLTFTLASCSGLPSFLFSGGGGPSVTAVGTQVAKEANQQVVNDQSNIRTEDGDIQVTELKDTVQTRDVESITIKNTDIPAWVIIALILGWLAPSPGEMGRGLMSLITSLRRKAQ